MTKTTKNLLGISIACLIIGLAFATGILNAHDVVALYVFLPLGAVFLGLFLIFRMLEKETALYDQEQAAHTGLKTAKVTITESQDHRELGRARPQGVSSR